jgi:hypothetical protein
MNMNQYNQMANMQYQQVHPMYVQNAYNQRFMQMNPQMAQMAAGGGVNMNAMQGGVVHGHGGNYYPAMAVNMQHAMPNPYYQQQMAHQQQQQQQQQQGVHITPQAVNLQTPHNNNNINNINNNAIYISNAAGYHPAETGNMEAAQYSYEASTFTGENAAGNDVRQYFLYSSQLLSCFILDLGPSVGKATCFRRRI